MYRNFSTKGQIIGSKSLFFFYLTLVTLCVVIIIYTYLNESAKLKNKNKITRFSNLIKEYTRSRDTLTEAEIELYKKTYHEDTLLSTLFGAQNWHPNVEIFGKIVEIHFSLLAAVDNPRSKYYKDPQIWNILDNTVKVISNYLPAPKHQTFPFGTNWYQFTITYPRFLVAYAYIRQMYNKPNMNFVKIKLTTFIAQYYQQPTKPNVGIISMGWARDSSNAVMAAVPYIGGKLFLNEEKKLRTDNVAKYVSEFTKIKYVTNGDGFYADGSFIFHGNVLRAYGYITSAYYDFVLVSKYFDHDMTPHLEKMLSMIEHPTIPLHFGPWFTRAPSLNTKHNHLGRFGFTTIAKIAGICVKTPKFFSTFNLQRPELCFYEADRRNSTNYMVWTQFRQPLDMDSIPFATYNTSMIPKFSGVITYGGRVPSLISNTSTTETFKPLTARSIICNNGVCVAGYQLYEIKHGHYAVKIEELFLITENGIHCTYNVYPEDSLGEEIHIGCYLGKSIQKINQKEYNIDHGKAYLFLEHSFDKVEYLTDTIEIPNSGDTLDSLAMKVPYAKVISFRFSIQYNSSFSEISLCDNCKYIKTLKQHVYIKNGYLYLFDKDKASLTVSKYMNIAGMATISVPSKVIFSYFKGSTKSNTIDNEFIGIIKNHIYQLTIDGVELIDDGQSIIDDTNKQPLYDDNSDSDSEDDDNNNNDGDKNDTEDNVYTKYHQKRNELDEGI